MLWVSMTQVTSSRGGEHCRFEMVLKSCLSDQPWHHGLKMVVTFCPEA